MSELLAGLQWTTPFIADACVATVSARPRGLSRPEVQLSPAVKRRARPGRLDTREAPTCFSRRSPPPNQGDLLGDSQLGGRNDEGCIGDPVVGEAFVSGLAATICWARIATLRRSRQWAPRVWSLGTCPATARSSCAGVSPPRSSAANIGSHVTVTLEDYVFADDDGVVVVATADLARIVDTARDIATREGAQAVVAAQGRVAASAARSRPIRRETQRRSRLHIP